MCAHCINHMNPADARRRPETIMGELDGFGIVHVDCPKGHQSVVLYDARRYEVLMQSAAKALLDGYTNEAMSTFSTALERAYEFFLRVVFRSRGIDQAKFEKAWKAVASQSERQFGAFHFIYLAEIQDTLDLDARIPTLRNNTVHRGRIARETEAREFAELVYARIRQIEKCLDEKHKEAAEAEAKFEIEQQKASLPKETEWIVLEVFSVKLDAQSNVIGFPDNFSEYILSIHKGRSSGFF